MINCKDAVQFANKNVRWRTNLHCHMRPGCYHTLSGSLKFVKAPEEREREERLNTSRVHAGSICIMLMACNAVRAKSGMAQFNKCLLQYKLGLIQLRCGLHSCKPLDMSHTTLGKAISSVTRSWLAPGVRLTRYELLLAEVLEFEQNSPVPPANSTCISAHASEGIW